MKTASRYWVVSVVLLSVVVLVSAALARGGHRGGRGGGAGGASLCSSAALLDLSLSDIDIMIKTSGNQTLALEELKKVAKDYSDNMSRVCAGDSLMSFPAKLAAAEDRLNATLVAEKFYATLNDEQKEQVNSLVDWPGL